MTAAAIDYRAALWAVVNRPLSEYRAREGYPNLGLTWRLDVCRDGTLSIRRTGQRSINDGHALPVYSTTTRRQAEDIQIILCFGVKGKHPDLPAGDWYKLNDVLKTGLEERGCAVLGIDDHQAIAWKIADVAEVLRGAQ